METNIPLREVPYEYYAVRAPRPAMATVAAKSLTVGSIGEKILEELIIGLDSEISTNSYDGCQVTGYPVC